MSGWWSRRRTQFFTQKMLCAKGLHRPITVGDASMRGICSKCGEDTYASSINTQLKASNDA